MCFGSASKNADDNLPATVPVPEPARHSDRAETKAEATENAGGMSQGKLSQGNMAGTTAAKRRDAGDAMVGGAFM